jgi:hypothetical protein
MSYGLAVQLTVRHQTARLQDKKTFFMKTKLTLLLLAFSAALMAQRTDKVASDPAVNYDWREGFVNITELNAGLGLGTTSVPYSGNYFGITTVNGYQFTRNIKAGIGIGVQIHNSGTLVPLFVDGRYSFSSVKYVPFLGAAAGWAVSIADLTGQTRVFMNPMAGIRYVAWPKIGVTFAAGFMMQSGGAEGRSSFINFKLGLEFKGKAWDK